MWRYTYREWKSSARGTRETLEGVMTGVTDTRTMRTLIKCHRVGAIEIVNIKRVSSDERHRAAGVRFPTQHTPAPSRPKFERTNRRNPWRTP